MPKKPPKFEVGDEVISFRGERATVTKVITVEHPGKSHRVTVRWQNNRDGVTDTPYKANPDNIDYYEHVFDHYKESHEN
jgi:hypothetical protein